MNLIYKKFPIQKLCHDTIIHIFDYLESHDIDDCLSQIKYFHKYISGSHNMNYPMTRRKLFLNNDSSYHSGIIKEIFQNNYVEKKLLQCVNNSNTMVNLLKNIIKMNKNDIGDFYIGGSVCTILAHLLNNMDDTIDINDYDASDINIYIISKKPIEDIKKNFITFSKKYLNNLIFKAYYENAHNVHFIFADYSLKRIQIILDVKESIEQHFEFVDLSINKFLLTSYNNDNYVLFSTEESQAALKTQIIRIYYPISKLTQNRIFKYIKRKFMILGLTNYDKIMYIYDICKNTHTLCDYDALIQHKINCNITHINDMQKIYKSLIDKQKNIIIKPIEEKIKILYEKYSKDDELHINSNITRKIPTFLNDYLETHNLSIIVHKINDYEYVRGEDVFYETDIGRGCTFYEETNVHQHDHITETSSNYIELYIYKYNKKFYNYYTKNNVKEQKNIYYGLDFISKFNKLLKKITKNKITKIK